MNANSHAFTQRAKGLSAVIATNVRISFGFNPQFTPNPPPPLRGFEAIWDTGATGTAISQRVIDQCALTPVGFVEVETAAGMCICEVYMINIFLPNGVGFPRVTVARADLKTTDVLIGMDLINKGDFALTHENGNTVFSFRYPSIATIDFSERA